MGLAAPGRPSAACAAVLRIPPRCDPPALPPGRHRLRASPRVRASRASRRVGTVNGGCAREKCFMWCCRRSGRRSDRSGLSCCDTRVPGKGPRGRSSQSMPMTVFALGARCDSAPGRVGGEGIGRGSWSAGSAHATLPNCSTPGLAAAPGGATGASGAHASTTCLPSPAQPGHSGTSLRYDAREPVLGRDRLHRWR